MGKYVNITGQRFGRWAVIADSGRKDGEVVWLCQCECGNRNVIKGGDLRSGKTKSCGCLKKDMGLPNKTHGESKTRLYKEWKGIKHRCNIDDGSRTYNNYGGRGIKVCEEWNYSYEAFRDWALTNGYGDGLSIERIDVNGNYEPDNCTFIPVPKQSVNRRNTLLTVNGETKTKAEWAKEIGVSLTTLSSRLNKLGWSPERAVSTPSRRLNRAE